MNPLREAALIARQIRAQSREAFAELLDELDDDDVAELARSWILGAHEYQLRPEAEQAIWLFCGGRGSGKTHAGANDLLDVEEDWGPAFKGILCSKTIGDVRDVMIQGESGLVAQAALRGRSVRYIANRALVELPHGGIAYVLSSEKPDKPRGYQSNYIWGDEISSWQHALETWMNLLYGWRLKTPDGRPPLMCLTTTPKTNPISFLLMRDEKYRDKVVMTRGRMQDNRANISEETIELLESVYAGTKLGLQELDGELLDMMGALVSLDTIAEFRANAPPELDRIIVSVDPSIMDNADSDEAGIIVVGADYKQNRFGEAFVLDDQTIAQARFSDWAEKAVRTFVQWGAHSIVAEINQGGTGVEDAIKVAAEKIGAELGRDLIVPVIPVWASKAKVDRAQPIGALYERGRVRHVGHFRELEKELTGWMPGMPSPNRLDAVVHGVTELLLGEDRVGPLSSYLVRL